MAGLLMGDHAGDPAPIVSGLVASGHRAFEPDAVLGGVNALRCASTPRSAGPSGIDRASAQRDVGDCVMAVVLLSWKRACYDVSGVDNRATHSRPRLSLTAVSVGAILRLSRGCSSSIISASRTSHAGRALVEPSSASIVCFGSSVRCDHRATSHGISDGWLPINTSLSGSQVLRTCDGRWRRLTASTLGSKSSSR